MLTKNGIELEIEESKYKYKYKDLTFYFSSLFYLHKFEKELPIYIDNETKKLYNKYKVKADVTLMLAIALYKKIEKRGFCVMVKGNNPVELYWLAITL